MDPPILYLDSPIALHSCRSIALYVTETTTVQVTKETWQRLKARKDLNESFDDVIASALDQSYNEQAAHATHDVR